MWEICLEFLSPGFGPAPSTAGYCGYLGNEPEGARPVSVSFTLPSK